VSSVPLNRLSKRWDINRESLRNHKANHITPALKALRTERIAAGLRPVVDRVEEDLIAPTAKMYEAARLVANMPLALKAVHEQPLRRVADPEAPGTQPPAQLTALQTS
jgi:hypothetical protein